MLYRTDGAWGSGLGVNLTPAQVDGNFYELRSDLDDLIANPPTANSIETITASGFTWTVTLTDGTILDPLPVPVVYTEWRGDWAPFTLYGAANQFRDPATGIYAVLQDHTSAATFDPDAVAGSPPEPLYLLVLAATSLPADTSLDELNDVTITGVADNDFIAWAADSSTWTNRTTAQVAALIGPLIDLALDDLGDVDTTGASPGDVLTAQGSPLAWVASPPAAVPTTLDALSDVAAPVPADGDFLQYNGGSPAGWVNRAGTSISGLAAATLPLALASLLEVSEPAGSPVVYTSKKVTVDDLLAAGDFVLGSTAIALGSTVTTVAGLTLNSPILVTPALGTPASGVLTNATGLPIGTGVSGLGTGIAAALAINVGSAGAPVLFNGALGTPASGTLTNATGLPVSSGISGLAAGVATFLGTPSSANLLATLTTKTGTVSAVFSESPTLSGTPIVNGNLRVTGSSFGSYQLLQDNGNGWRAQLNNDTNLYIQSTANSFSSATNRLRLFGGGDVIQGTGSAIATTATDGFFAIATCAGPPTGVPTNAGAGQIQFVYDKTNNRIYCYNGAWRMVAVA